MNEPPEGLDEAHRIMHENGYDMVLLVPKPTIVQCSPECPTKSNTYDGKEHVNCNARRGVLCATGMRPEDAVPVLGNLLASLAGSPIVVLDCASPVFTPAVNVERLLATHDHDAPYVDPRNN